MDDPYGAVIAGRAACPVISYGVEYRGDVQAIDVSSSVDGLSGTLVTPKGTIPFASRLLGRFNLANILAAVSAGIASTCPWRPSGPVSKGTRPFPDGWSAWTTRAA